MSLNYRNLDARTRQLMVLEIKDDIAKSRINISNRLNPEGISTWPELLQEAALSHSDAWLASEIRTRHLLKKHEERRRPSGGTTTAKVPITASDTLAEGEFNRFYIRALCLRAIEDNIPHVIAYRARHSESPRPQSEAIIGNAFSPIALLNELRAAPSIDPAFPGPNSGLSVYLP